MSFPRIITFPPKILTNHFRFRWAVCQIDVLQRLRNEKDVKNALRHLPKTLDETYQRIFELLNPEDRHLVRSVLVYICANNLLRPVPISLQVLLEALEFGGNSVQSRFETLRDSCGCLISITMFQTQQSVMLAHYTVKEYLFSERISNTSVSEFALGNNMIGRIIMRWAVQVVVTKYLELPFVEYGSLLSYCLIVLQTYILALRAFDIDQHTTSELEEIDVLLGLDNETYKGFKDSVVYIMATNKMIRAENYFLLNKSIDNV